MFDRLLGNAGVMSIEDMEKDFGQLLAEDGEFQIGFKVMRDTFLFTDRRLVLVDVQGMTGRKKEFLSIPYDKITMYSVESAGFLDRDEDFKLWVGSNPNPIERKFNKSVDIYAVQQVLAAKSKG
jgi:hypothetical protein